MSACQAACAAACDPARIEFECASDSQILLVKVQQPAEASSSQVSPHVNAGLSHLCQQSHQAPCAVAAACPQACHSSGRLCTCWLLLQAGCAHAA